MGAFDLDERYSALSAAGDPLIRPGELADFEPGYGFCGRCGARTALCRLRVGQCRLQIPAELLKIQRRRVRLKLIAQIAQPPFPIPDIKETPADRPSSPPVKRTLDGIESRPAAKRQRYFNACRSWPVADAI